LASVGIIKINADQKPYKYKVTNPELAESANLDLPTPQDIKEEISERNAIIREQGGRITADVC